MNGGLPDARQGGLAAPADGLLPGRGRHEPQAARARGDASVLQAAQEGAGRRPLRHQPGRLEHAQGRRAPPLDPPRRSRAARARERLPALSYGCARLPPRDSSRASSSPTSCSSWRSGTAPARTRAVPSSWISRRSTSRWCVASATTASTSAATCPRRRSGRSSIAPTPSARRTGESSRARSSSRVRASFTSSSVILRRVSRPTS